MGDPEAIEIMYLRGKYGSDIDLDLAREYEKVERKIIHDRLVQGEFTRN